MRRVQKALILLLRLAVGALLLWAAVLKLRDPQLFAQDIANYRMLPAGIVGAAFTGNQVLLIPDPYHDPRFNREVDKKTGYRTRNILSAPMANLDRKPLGVVQAINKRGGSVFTAEDVELAGQLGRFAGGLIGLGVEVDGLRHAAGVT